MIEDIINITEEKLRESGKSAGFEQIIDIASKVIIDDIQKNENEKVMNLMSNHDEFVKNNRIKWDLGFKKLYSLREICLQAGMNFQQQFLKIEKYQTDELLGVLLRQHAHACRISSEIIHLLEGGYPDAAFARWRTLYEMVITCLIITKCGKDAAIDYIKHGLVKNSEGIEEHIKTSKAMGHETFTDEEAIYHQTLKHQITNGDSSWHWARKHTGYSKIEKLREFVGLDMWSHDYKLASRNIHSDYYEMSSLFAMRETEHDLLLCGQSNSGLTEPAHSTAIALAQITYLFLCAYIEDENSDLDYTESTIFIKIIDNYVNQVGEAFLTVDSPI
jgi:hypothetical protein